MSLLSGCLGRQRRKEEEERQEVRHPRAWNRTRGSAGRQIFSCHYFREERQEGVKVPTQGSAVPVHERGPARAQAQDANGTRMVYIDCESPAWFSLNSGESADFQSPDS